MSETFDKAVSVMRRLMVDFDLEDFEAAAIVGNLIAESGLKAVQEKNPTVKGSRGGFGWAQWTGPRRRAFEQFCARTHQDPTSDAANYNYLWRELSGHEPGFDYRHAIEQLKKTTTLVAATDTFEAFYEKAGIKHLAARRKAAELALRAFHARPGADDEAGAGDEVKRIQEKLAGSGYDPGPIDGIVGPRTLGAIAAALGV